MSPRIWLQKLKLAPNSKETSAKISVLVTILWTEPWICAQKLKFDHHKLSVNLAVSPQIGCFFKTAPLLFLSSYWNGHVSVTIRWINHNIQSTGPVGLTSLWSSVRQLGAWYRRRREAWSDWGEVASYISRKNCNSRCSRQRTTRQGIGGCFCQYSLLTQILQDRLTYQIGA